MTVDIRVGDCLLVMPALAADSVDAIVTDPPYGLKFMGKAWDHGVPGAEFWREALRVAKPGAHLVAFGGTRTFHRLTCAIEDAGWEIRDCLSWLYGSGFPKSHNGPWGGTALKPAWEPVILARKPLAGTVEGNHARFGTGALNIDGCRVHFASQDDQAAAAAQRSGRDQNEGRTAYGRFENGEASIAPYLAKMDAGRWPANVCLDDDAARALDEQSGESRSTIGKPRASQAPGAGYGMTHTGAEYADAGGASRFFYTAKASRSERNAGLDGMPERKPHPDEPNGRAWDIPGSHSTARANHHPTVKPLDLMQWLCRLVTPKGGVVLDPFMGSGSTGRAAIAEGFHFIGIELSDEYAEIARARIAEYAPLFAEGA